MVQGVFGSLIAIFARRASVTVFFELAYSAAIYWVFRGKVQLNEHSY